MDVSMILKRAKRCSRMASEGQRTVVVWLMVSEVRAVHMQSQRTYATHS